MNGPFLTQRTVTRQPVLRERNSASVLNRVRGSRRTSSLVQAFLQDNGEDPYNHELRDEALSNWPDVAAPYGRLKGLGSAARYDAKHAPERVNEALMLLPQIRAGIEKPGGFDGRGRHR
jgi:hypothetical protein